MKFKGLKPREYWLAYLLANDRIKLGYINPVSPDIRIEYLASKMQKSPEETAFLYIKRIKRTLPNFPKIVIKTWLFEHNDQLDEFLEQPLESFIFKKSFLKLSDILKYKPQKNSPVEKNLKQLSDVEYQRDMQDPNFPMTKIREYLKEHGVWPGFTVIIDTESILGGYFVKGYPLNKPFDILEGFRRFSVVKHYIGTLNINAHLPIYRIYLAKTF